MASYRTTATEFMSSSENPDSEFTAMCNGIRVRVAIYTENLEQSPVIKDRYLNFLQAIEPSEDDLDKEDFDRDAEFRRLLPPPDYPPTPTLHDYIHAKTLHYTLHATEDNNFALVEDTSGRNSRLPPGVHNDEELCSSFPSFDASQVQICAASPEEALSKKPMKVETEGGQTHFFKSYDMSDGSQARPEIQNTNQSREPTLAACTSANCPVLYGKNQEDFSASYCLTSTQTSGETGNDPKHDPKYPDPRPHGYKGKLQCGTFKPTNVISISYGGSEISVPAYYQKRQCNEFLKLALRGISVFVASGDSGSSCITRYPTNRELWLPGQTVGCPWVTGVGATQIDRGNTVEDPETGAEENYAGISSSGGFSNLFDRPWYQNEAVPKYFGVSKAKDLPHYKNGKYRGNDGFFNVDGRGIPDISAFGTNIAIFNKGRYRGLSGSSASAPIVTALFNRIVEERIRAGKRGRLGLVNPVLYKHPEVLNDIVKGNNGVCVKHLRIFVGKQYGYNANEGWDPMTHLGTPKYPELLKIFKDLP